MDESSLLRSHIVPPSHILANGQFIHLPPPSSYERSTFFERSVAEHGLIDVGDENDIHGKSKGKSRDEKKKRRQVDDNDTGGGSEGVLSDTNKAKRKKQASAGATTSHIHPFAIASARLRSKGMEELSKAINLSGLVMGGEYFGLTHVIDQQQRLITSNKDSSTSDNGAADKGKNGGSSGVADPSSSSGGGGGKTCITATSIPIRQCIKSSTASFKTIIIIGRCGSYIRQSVTNITSKMASGGTRTWKKDCRADTT